MAGSSVAGHFFLGGLMLEPFGFLISISPSLFPEIIMFFSFSFFLS